MNIIFSSLCLAFISRADCYNYKGTFEGCKGSPEIYLQWYPPVSGWYTWNLKTKNEYSRYLPNVTELERYEFYLERGEWYLTQWTKESSKSIELKIKEDNIISKLPKALNNYIKAFNNSTLLSRRKRSGRRNNGLTSDNLGRNRKVKATTTEMPIPVTKTKPLENQDMKNQTMTMADVPEFNVYCPGRCKCKTAVALTPTETNFTRFDVADSHTAKKCWEKIENATELPEENKVAHRLQKDNQPTTDNAEHNGINYDALNLKKNQWKPELYVSKNCEVLYYNKLYDTWIADFEWEARSCNTFISGAALDNYISNNSAPCLEYLPVDKFQQWSNPQPYNGTTEDSDEIIEHCEMNFTLQSNKHFKVMCSEYE